ncbi:hypothetical protein HXP44_21715 [Streptomyces sioyaensis]|uniref:Uncharacterized protein n=1 Tax=Streptomyces sioyaensis TaxID=67364 RepID=A0A4Q1QWM4_9ACTN|nr:hypothetical protein [Streptomyces sioyaensis]MBM4794608.1 hypothetical protein [Streptomyces sioyaensis]RXS62272.1 hypothetical protein EST54_25550 [Streptomyces sioyaensis]
MAGTVQRRRLALPAAALAGAVAAVSTGLRLAAYHVPASLSLSCALSVLASTVWLIAHIADALTVTTYRCQAPGCDFRVRLRITDAAESRRWQKIAAEHPSHGYRP